MDEINTNPELDFKIRTAILATNPDGISIIGAWDCMKTLAKADPDDCVRLCPGLPMDSAALAAFFHCSVAIVEKTVEVFTTLGRLSVKDGLLRIAGCAGDNGAAPRPALHEKSAAARPVLTEEALARKREQDRIRKAKSRARQKQEAQTGKPVPPVTKRDMCDRECDTEDKDCDTCDCGHTVTITSNKNSIDIKDIEKNKDDKDIFSFSGKEKTETDILLSYDRHSLIPLQELPSPFREIVEVWNRLPLKKLEGLYPALLFKLQGLLYKFRPETLVKAIHAIGESPFLLGRSENSTGFVISFKWFLSIPHLENILAGKYKSFPRNRSLRYPERPARNRYPDNAAAITEKAGVSLEDLPPAERCLALARFHNYRIAGAA